jgi:hypothetical protein
VIGRLTYGFRFGFEIIAHLETARHRHSGFNPGVSIPRKIKASLRKQAFMSRPGFAMPSAAGIALVLFLLPAAALCQAPAAKAPSTAPAVPASAAQASTPQADPNSAFLAKASSLYYSTNKVGLTGFDCAVHPDWANIFKTVSKGASTDDSEKPVALLNSVKITIHARLTGAGSGLDWTPDTSKAPTDQNSIDLLDHMHQATSQTLQGFLQFWTPFVNGSVIPDSSAGIEITKTSTGHTIHAMDGSTSLTETLDESNLLKQFDVEMGGAKISFDPSYKPTPNGLLVSTFAATILPPGATPAQQQKMNVGVEYQTVNGFEVPRTLSMDVVGTGTFSFTFDGCTVNPAQ